MPGWCLSSLGLKQCEGGDSAGRGRGTRNWNAKCKADGDSGERKVEWQGPQPRASLRPAHTGTVATGGAASGVPCHLEFREISDETVHDVLDGCV